MRGPVHRNDTENGKILVSKFIVRLQTWVRSVSILCNSVEVVILRVRHAKSPMALFSMFIYIMHRTFAIPDSESTLHRLNFRSLKQEEFEGALLYCVCWCRVVMRKVLFSWDLETNRANKMQWYAWCGPSTIFLHGIQQFYPNHLTT